MCIIIHIIKLKDEEKKSTLIIESVLYRTLRIWIEIVLCDSWCRGRTMGVGRMIILNRYFKKDNT